MTRIMISTSWFYPLIPAVLDARQTDKSLPEEGSNGAGSSHSFKYVHQTWLEPSTREVC